jgi:hypothetical protein
MPSYDSIQYLMTVLISINTNGNCVFVGSEDHMDARL